MTNHEILHNQVNCRNMVNSQSEKVRAELNEIFAEFIGKKIVKFTPYKSLSAAVTKKIQHVYDGLESCGYHFYFEVGYSSVYASVKARYKVSETSCGYCKQEFFVAGFDKDTGVMIEENRKFCKIRDDYTVQEILDARENIARLESELSVAKYAISEFH